MCLAIPGKILEVAESDDPLFRTGRVSFEGIVKDIQLAYTPDAQPGDYVLVHVGFAIAVVDEAEARRTLELIEPEDALPAGRGGGG
ncbi:MAG: HypC/HybG/HupF family hydrogenase formation chaperone [Akkermansiaceae bacterium]|nr:HypC/HybG/HupF family hydrogenase formation chaperone [Akkermansiaceae bacterium]